MREDQAEGLQSQVAGLDADGGGGQSEVTAPLSIHPSSSIIISAAASEEGGEGGEDASIHEMRCAGGPVCHRIQ